MRTLIAVLLLSGCFSPVGESRPGQPTGASCVDSVRPISLPPIIGASIAGQFFSTDSGYAFATLIATDDSFDTWWTVGGEPETDGPVLFSPIWFHPDGYRSVMIAASGRENALWLLDIDSLFRTRQATLLAMLPSSSGFSFLTAPHTTGRRLDLCVSSFSGSIQLLTIDGRSVVQRMPPDGAVRCLDAVEYSDGSLFLVKTGDGGQRVLRVDSVGVGWLSGQFDGDCRLASADVVSTWCVDGRRLWRAGLLTPSVVDFEFVADSGWDSLEVLSGGVDVVVARESGSARYSIVSANGARRTVESVGERPFFGVFADGGFGFGARRADGGVDLNSFCW